MTEKTDGYISALLGEALFEWCIYKLTSEKLPGVVLNVKCTQDAMKTVDENGVPYRFMVTADQQQQIADVLGCIFHTTKTADQRHAQAKIVLPAVVRVDGGITARSSQKRYNEEIDKLIAARCVEPEHIVSTVGKPWILTNGMAPGEKRAFGDRTAINYGWHSKDAKYKSAIGQDIWQPAISAFSAKVHNSSHADPSQVCDMLLRGAELVENNKYVAVDLADIYMHPKYSALVSYNGPMKIVRQPSTPIAPITPFRKNS